MDRVISFFNKLKFALLIFLGFFVGLVYYGEISSAVNNSIFSDETVTAFKFTLGRVVFMPVSYYLAFLTVMLILFIINCIRVRSFKAPDKSLILKHTALLLAVCVATVLAMQCRTTVYTDGSIKAYNFIEKYSPEYSPSDYKKATLSGQSTGSISPERPYRTYFQFSFIFYLEDGKYIEIYAEDFRDKYALKALSETLGEKFSLTPENGLSANEFANMSEYEYELYRLMYYDEDEDEDEDFTEQDHYGFDGYYDFAEDYYEEYTVLPESFTTNKHGF